jgi:hypothetical protein
MPKTSIEFICSPQEGLLGRVIARGELQVVEDMLVVKINAAILPGLNHPIATGIPG